MPSSYQPFLIAPLKTGLELDIQPWMLPPDAFTTLLNAYTRNGVLSKIQGYSEFCDTGSSDAVVGIAEYTKTDGTTELLIATVDRLYKYSGSVTDLDSVGGDYWTGDEDNLVHFCQWGTNIYMANNKDQCRKYTGSAVAVFDIDIDGGGNDVNYCKFIMLNKRRLIIFAPAEGGTLYPQRARWCVAGDPTDWTNDEYIDAPTDEWIRGVAYLGDDIAVWFERSMWLFEYTGDSTLPFRWRRIDSAEGITASFTSLEHAGKVYGLGKAGLLVGDEVGVKRLDAKVPDYTLYFNQEYLNRCHGIRIEQLRQIWTAFPYNTATTPDRVLAWNYDENSWAVYQLPFLCFGSLNQEDSVKWSDLSAVKWEEYDEEWIAGAISKGYPMILGGGTDGKVYRLNYGGTLGGSDIPLEIESARWNPFNSKGLKSRLGWIDFLVTTNSIHEVTVDFYLDFNSQAYQSKTLSFDSDGEKAWVRIYSGAVGNSHRININHTASGQRIQIHAIMPYFKPAGRIINV
jgi:hypothetical protein